MNGKNKQDLLPSRIRRLLATAAILSLCGYCATRSASAQTHVVIHKPQAKLEIQGFLRRMKLDLADYSIELNPGWLVTESKDSATGITIIRCTDPSDSTSQFLEVISHPADGTRITANQWSRLKDQLRSRYGDKKIGTKVLDDTTMFSTPGYHGVLAIFEVLARFPDHLQFAATVVTRTETLLLTADIPDEDYLSKINYFSTIVSGIRQHE